MKTLEITIKDVEITVKAEKLRDIMLFLVILVSEARRIKNIDDSNFTLFATIKEDNFPDREISFVI